MWILVGALLLAIGGLVVSAYKRRIVNVATVNEGVDEFWDFLGFDEGPFQSTLGGSAQFSGNAPHSEGYYPGAVTTFLQFAADSVRFTTSLFDGVNFIGNSSDFQIRLTPSSDVQTISTANFKRAGGIGFFASTTGIEVGTAQGVYFHWDGDTSDNFICKYISPTTTETVITTHAFAIEDLYLRIIVNPAASYFYINNVLVYQSTHGGSEFATVGFPAPIMYGFKDYKIDGGANVGMSVDAIKFVQKLQTPRQFAAVT
jgi:hypothetical protein